jgi:hypothetical protein
MNKGAKEVREDRSKETPIIKKDVRRERGQVIVNIKIKKK